METSYLLTQGNLTIPCVQNDPEFAPPRRIVLGVHGLGGNTRDAIQESLAEEMELFDSAVFRFDLPRHGEAPESGAPLNLGECVDSLLAVARDARSKYPDVEDLCIFATGFGAYLTLVALEELIQMPGTVKLVVQTPSVRMHETLLAMKRISRATLQAMDRVTLNTSRRMDIDYSFYTELEAHNVLITHPIPMLILHGDEDSYIRWEDIQNFRRINEHSKLVIIPGTSHRFLEEGAWDMVLDLTRDWFEFEQVLLCDWS